MPLALRALIAMRLAALSRWRSNRRISFWRFWKVSMVVSSSQPRKVLNGAAVWTDGRCLES